MSKHLNKYYNLDEVEKSVAAGDHRGLIGGMWDEIGKLQFDYVREYHLRRDMHVLDIGCGCFRGGHHFIDFLEPNRYFGIDISQPLIDAGYERELGPRGLQEKLPHNNLAINFDFDASSFCVKFDVVIAQSVFTHLPLNHYKLCLDRIAPHMFMGGRFFASFFLAEAGQNWSRDIRHEPGGITTHHDRDPFHYQIEDLRHCTNDDVWDIEYAGDWKHPRNQKIVVLRNR